jgi:hypothetical protein
MLNEATRQFIRAHCSENVRQLALQGKPAPDVDFQAALTQIAGRQAVKHKIPSWHECDNLLYPTRLPLEQCSSEAAARYKASLLDGRSFVDLTGGFGVDTAFIAARFPEAVYVEQQAELAALARHNFPLLGLPHIQIHPADSRQFLQTMQPVDCLYLDPARRAPSGRKIVQIADCEPDILALQDQLLSKADRVLIKLSPMLDLHAAQKSLKNIRQIHIVSVDNECKELLFLLQKGPAEEPPVFCVHITPTAIQTDVFTVSEEKMALPACISAADCTPLASAPTPLQYLYEPNPSLLKGGFFKSLAHRYAVAKLHPDSHLYTSDRLLPTFPGRIFRIESVSSFNKKALQTALQATPCAHIATRNFPLTAQQLRSRLKLKDGGDTYLFATTLVDGGRVLVRTRKV